MVWNKNFFNEVKTCQKCEVVLVKDDNWGGSKYICRPCDAEKSRLARLKKKQENPHGYVYVVFNPAWSEWYVWVSVVMITEVDYQDIILVHL